MKTTTILPPEILEYFDNKLLESSCKLGDSAEKFKKIYRGLVTKLDKKNMSPQKKKKYEKSKREFLYLYEKASEKENTETKIRHKAQGPMYYVRLSCQNDETVYHGLRFGRGYAWRFKQSRKHHKI